MRLVLRLAWVLRMAMSGKFVPADVPRGVLDLLTRAGGASNLQHLELELADIQKSVREKFEEIVGKVEMGEGGKPQA